MLNAKRHCKNAVGFTLQDVFGNKKLMGGTLFVHRVTSTNPASLIDLIFSKQARHVARHLMRFLFPSREPSSSNVCCPAAMQRFASFLLAVGNGRVRADEESNILLPRPMLFNAETDERRELVAFVYSGIREKLMLFGQNANNWTDNARWVAERAILAPTHEIVSDLNRKISGAARSTDNRTKYRHCNRPDLAATQELLNATEFGGFLPHFLSLCTGDCVVVLRNLSNVLKNGVRAIVLSVSQKLLKITVASGSALETIHTLPRMKLIDVTFASGFDTKMTRIQFPVAPAWAITINKAQGQTLQRLGLYLSSSVFSHSMLYVALSRCPALGAIRIACARTKDGQQTRVARNVVWPELLSQQPPAQLFEYPEECN